MADILVADDTRSIRTALSILLEEAGHTVRLASNGDEALSEYGRRRPDMLLLDIVMPKKNGYQVLVLSNFSHKAVVECAHVLDFLPYTDGGILSYKDHVIKPQPEIYELLINRYQLVPEECVFMDDLEENIKGAANAGIHTILFKDEMQAKSKLREMGVKF